MSIIVAFLLFACAAVAVFMMLPVRVAILLVFIGGWIVLPFGSFPAVPRGTLAFWVTGLALPGDVVVSKAWVAPLVALLSASIVDRDAWRALRPNAMDMPVVAWCLWPLVVGWIVATNDPKPLAASAYLFASWSCTWLIGRIWFSDREGRDILIKGLALAGIACVPIALLEMCRGPFLHDLVYGPHPFRFDGDVRYIGHRPLGFFEHGNQYGIWVALSAVAALAWAAERRGWIWIVAVVTGGLAIASQSAGAIFLGVVVIAALLSWSRKVVRYAAAVSVLVIIAGGLVQLSGVVPIRHVAEQTSVGAKALNIIRASGRGSFAWRVSQDLRTIDAVRAAPLAGTGHWDWWRPTGTRPWGLWMLLAGQYGLVGMALAMGSLLLAAGAVLRQYRQGASLALALIVVAAIGDALLNAFLYFPAILAAGAIATKVGTNLRGDDHEPA